MNPQECHGKTFAVAMVYEPQDGMAEGSVFGGKAAWDGQKLIVDRGAAEEPFEINSDWFERIEQVPPDLRKTLLNCDLFVLLQAGDIADEQVGS